jgi:cephalosporin hydroxylase
MKITLDTTGNCITIEDESGVRCVELYSKEGFELLSQQWLEVGWNEKYPYTFTWMGRPIIQLPEDILRVQEVIYSLKPDVIIETGVAHGGSLILYAGLCKAMGKGRVIGVDIEIRQHNRSAIESHELAPLVSLIEASSTDASTVAQVRHLVTPHDTVMVILDSCHTKNHVASELALYSPLVTHGSYIVATDGSMKHLATVPRGRQEWEWDNPMAAAIEFAASNPDFELQQPKWRFNESELDTNITHWPSAWLRRRSQENKLA